MRQYLRRRTRTDHRRFGIVVSGICQRAIRRGPGSLRVRGGRGEIAKVGFMGGSGAGTAVGVAAGKADEMSH